jgi:glycerate 2-kinase
MTKNKSSELIDIFNAALAAVDPYHAVLKAARLEQNCLHIGGAFYDLEAFKRIVVVGAGKATSRMAMAIESLLGARIYAGLIIVKDGHTAQLDIIRQVEAAHPVPNLAGVDGTQKILHMARLADEETLFICLISGGASALLVAPADGVTLADKQEVTSLLLKSGANIFELNAVRKHLSAVKGGRLAQAAFPAKIVTLILSDVIGDRLDVIASGPTAQDGSTYADAWTVIEKYRLQQQIPIRVTHHLQLGMAGKVSETVKQGDACLHNIHNVIVGGISMALNAAKEKSQQLGIGAQIINAELQGEARDAARFLAQTAHATLSKMRLHERRCLLSGGETTVTVKGAGMGGRNQELALAFAIEIEGLEGISLLSAGTDGSDGPNDAAGAMIKGSTAALAHRLGIEPVQYLADNDSYHFFQKFDASTGEHTHLITGPTGTNVMDIQIMLLYQGK